MHRQLFGNSAPSEEAVPAPASEISSAIHAGEGAAPTMPLAASGPVGVATAATAVTTSELATPLLASSALARDASSAALAMAAGTGSAPVPAQRKAVFALQPRPLQTSRGANVQHVESSLVSKPAVGKISSNIALVTDSYPLLPSFEAPSPAIPNPSRPKQCIRL